MNTNKNSYTIIYASIVVIVVAFLLSFVSKVLEPQSQANERIDKKKQILSALNIRNLQNEEVEKKYDEVVLNDEIINAQGQIIKDGKGKDHDGFTLDFKQINKDNLPVYVCKAANGETKYIFPLVGKGLWGSIWGYIALNSDMNIVYGAYFSHESETAGLGALIKEQDFQNRFVGKKIFKDGSEKVELSVVKSGTVKDPVVEVDGITGATLTSRGVNDMIQQGLANYSSFLKNQTNNIDSNKEQL